MSTRTKLFRLWSLAAVVAMLVALVPVGGPNFAASAQASDPVINEFVLNHTGSDTEAFIEIFGDSSTDYSGMTVLEIEGDGSGAGVIDAVLPLTSTDAGGFWVDDEDAENGTVTLLLVEGFTGAFGDDLDADDDGVVDTPPWTRIVDGIAVTDGDGGDQTYAEVTLNPGFDGGTFPVGGASRIPNGVDTNSANDWVRNDFDGAGLPGFSGTPEDGEALNTPGTENLLGESPPPAQAELVVNEIDYDQPSTDAAEFIEIKNIGDGEADLSLATLVLINGSNSTTYQTFALGSGSLAVGDYFVVCGDAANVNNCDLDVTPDTNLIQNGSPDAVGLMYDGTLVDAVSYEGDTAAPYTEGSGAGLEDDSSVENAGVSRYPDGVDTDQNNVDFSLRCSSPGEENKAAISDCVQAPIPMLMINELDADTAGTDTLEFVELYDGGVGDQPLDGLVIVFFNGNGDAAYASYDLDGYSTDAYGYFLLGNTGITPTPDITFGSNGLQNGADAVAVYQGEAADFPGGTSITTSGLIDAIVYDTNDGDDSGLLVLLNSGQPQVNEDGAGDKDNHSNQRCPNGSGGFRNTDSFTQAEPTPGAANACGSVGAPDVSISEIRIDQPGGDDDEYFELAGASGTGLDGLSYLVIGDTGSANSGIVENVTDLAGSTIGSSGFFVAAESSFTLGSADLTTSLNFENSDNVTHLLVWEFTGANGDDLDTDDDGVLDVEPWVEVVDLIALIKEENPPSGTEYHYGPPTVGPDGSFVPGQVFLCEDGWRIGDFGPGGTDTPGAVNACEPPVLSLKIHEVQGAGAASPYVGSTVLIEGIVVGDFQADASDPNDELNGFHVQEEDVDADGDPLTSEGIFVYDGFSPGVDVQVGDLVQVEGTVSEFFGLTEITSFSGVSVISSGKLLPTAAEPILPFLDDTDFEAYEGMLVRFAGPLYISEYFNFDRYGEIVLTTQRQYQPTAIFEPGSPDSSDLALQNERSRIILDDGRSNQNPDPARHPNGVEFTLNNRFRGGDTLNEVVGVMDYSFGDYKIQPTTGAIYSVDNARPPEAPNVGGGINMAAFNVLNYFTTIDKGAWICGPEADQECRGADNAEELDRQRAKIVSALTKLEADVVGLIEIENDGDDSSVADLVAGINDVLGDGTYDYIATGFIGSDAIKQAFIYKPTTVSLVGGFAVLDTPAFVDPLGYGDDKSRPALTQTFMSNQTGGMVTVSVNHLKSKGSPCDEGAIGDDDPQTGSCNLTRTLAAKELAEWLAAGPTGYPEVPVIIIGDLNSYDKEDPIDELKAAGYDDLLLSYQGEFAYSYVFDGQLGYLDYAMASADILQSITGAAAWHINADEPDILDYDTSFKQDAQDALYEPNEYRSSDHDPVVVGLTPLPQCNGLNATIYVNPDGVIVGGPWDGRDYRNVIFGTAGDDVIVGTDLSDVIHGKGGNDVICSLEGDDVIQARRGNDYLNAGAGNDVVIGHFGDDVLIGGAGHDMLMGMQGDDEIYAGPGRDLLNGHRGNDVCNGGDDGDRDRAVQCETEVDIP